ncbi:MAG TPA: ATP-binding protein [Fimbriiglobus sp.]|jgi:signal transduction histidine kinase
MKNNVDSVRAAQELEISIREIRTQFDRYLITLDKKYLEPVQRMKHRTSDAMQEVERTATTPKEQALINRTKIGYNHFFAQYDDLFRKTTQPLYPKIFELIDTVLIKEILDPAHMYLSLNEEMLSQNTQENRDLADRLTTGLIALGLCGSLGGMLAGTVIAVAIRRSLLQAERQLRSTAEILDQAAHPGQPTPEEKPSDAVERMTVSASAVLQRLRRTERDALRAEQLAWVGQMAAGIAHEIRNPLMAIKLLVQAAAERQGVAGFRPRDLQVLDEEIVRLEQIVSGFLDFARPPRLEPRPVDVKELVERTVDGIRARAELQGVDVRIEPAFGPTVVSADPNQLRQVLYNLLFNALEAQPQGGHIGLRIELNQAAEGNPELLLSVEDGGPGLPVDLGDRVFDPFVSTKESGLGLGLSICRRIAETHGGRLTADRTVGGGAVFNLRLPVIRPKSLPSHDSAYANGLPR